MTKVEDVRPGLTIVIRRDLNEIEKEELIEIIKEFEFTAEDSTIGFF